MGNNPILHNDPLGDSTPPSHIRLLAPPDPNGGQTGLIRNATVDFKEKHPILAGFQDFLHGVASVVGLNAVDDISANVRQKSDNGDLDIVNGTQAALGIAFVAPGQGGQENPIASGENPVIPDNATVVRGGTNTPATIQNGTGTHPEGVTGVSVECGTCSVQELAAPLPHNQVGVTTVGAVRQAGGDVIRTTGRSPNHATLTGLSPEKASQLLNPTVPNPNK
jgi:hypothetical protein